MGATVGFSDSRVLRIGLLSAPVLMVAVWCVNEFLNGTSGGFLGSPDPGECARAMMRIEEIHYELSQLEGKPFTELEQAELYVEKFWLESYYGHCPADGLH